MQYDRNITYIHTLCMWLEDFVPPPQSIHPYGYFREKKGYWGRGYGNKEGGGMGDEAPQKIDDKK